MAGELPAVGYHRSASTSRRSCCSGRRWWRCFGIWALPLVQVWVDHRRRAGACIAWHATRLWIPRLAGLRGLQLLRRQAVIGPPGATSPISANSPGLFPVDAGATAAALVVGGRRRCCPALIREDTGVLLVGIALWMVVRRQHPLGLAMALGGLGIGWVLLVDQPVDADLQ